ncbi:MAG TPA: glycosyl transferase family 2 [Firmicutes bacterium]|jgi:polyisoprenyl-phosphate glycosyltransferase|nr:glycosyl transferase family 2 [Bacillota bacterium]
MNSILEKEKNNQKLNLEKNFISVVVYLRNHEEYIEAFIKGLTDKLGNYFEKYEIIFVNDYSTDQTVRILKETAVDLKGVSISIINLSYYQGLETAIIAGVDMAIGDFVFEFDTSMVDYDFEEIMKVYYHSLKGYDIVSASPEIKGPFSSKLFYDIFRRYSKNNIQLNTERFRIISRRGINRINLLSTVIPYRKAIYFNCGLKAANLKYKPINLEISKKTMQPSSERMELAINSLLFFTKAGSNFAMYMAIAMLCISIFVIGYTILVFLLYKRVVEGWTTIMFFSSVAFTGVFALLTVLIKYVSLILFIQQNKEKYVYESIEKLIDLQVNSPSSSDSLIRSTGSKTSKSA